MKRFLCVLGCLLLASGISWATCPTPAPARVIYSGQVVSYPAPVVYKPVEKVVVKEVVKVIEPVAVPVAVFAPLAVQVPVYSTGYAPPVTAPAAGAAVSAHGYGHGHGATGYRPGVPGAPAPVAPAPTAQPGLNEIAQALRRIDARLDALERRTGQPVPGPPAPEPPGPPTPPPMPPPVPEKKDPFAPKAGAGITTPASPDLGRSALAIFQGKCAACHEAGVASDQGGGFVLLDRGTLAAINARQAGRVFTSVYAGRMPKAPAEKLTDQEVGVIAAWADAYR